MSTGARAERRERRSSASTRARYAGEGDPALRRAHLLHDIPVGPSVNASQMDVQFRIDGVDHALQMGPQPVGHCFSDVPAVHGGGTTTGTIVRPDSTTWIVDLPPRSLSDESRFANSRTRLSRARAVTGQRGGGAKYESGAHDWGRRE